MNATAPHFLVRISLQDRSDDDLVRLARGGMLRAFDVLVNRHQTLALRTAASHLSDSTLVRDASQQAFLELFRGLDRYQAREKFKPFLRQVVINQCRMLSRAYTSAKRRNDQLLYEPAPNTTSALECVHRRELRHALSQLTKKLRVVVILRYGEELSLSEIADRLQVPVGTVKRRLFDAMKRLREIFCGEP